jgi:hypothetical protein
MRYRKVAKYMREREFGEKKAQSVTGMLRIILQYGTKMRCHNVDASGISSMPMLSSDNTSCSRSGLGKFHARRKTG